jgi:P4 family phage/plasmid primase-like protien
MNAPLDLVVDRAALSVRLLDLLDCPGLVGSARKIINTEWLAFDPGTEQTMLHVATEDSVVRLVGQVSNLEEMLGLQSPPEPAAEVAKPATRPPTPLVPAAEPKASPKAAEPAVEAWEAAAEGETITFTAYSPAKGRFVGKRILDDGSKVNDGFPDTQATKQSMSLSVFAGRIAPNIFLTAGVFDEDMVIVVPAGAPDIEGKATRRRTKDDLSWPKGPGLMVIDNDFSDKTGPTLDVLEAVVPALKDVGCVTKHSSGSSVHAADGSELRGKMGEHVLFGVLDAADIPRAMLVLHKHLILKGYDCSYVGAAGQYLERSPVDLALAQTQQPVFLAANLAEGLTQHLDVVHRPGVLLDTKRLLPDLSADEESAFKKHMRAAKQKAKPKMAEAKEACIKRRVADGWTEADAREALQHGRLTGSAVLTLADGTTTTVAAVLSDPERFHGKTCLDPVEPEYRDGAVVGKIYARDGKLRSQAHGGKSYTLGVEAAADDFAEEARKAEEAVGGREGVADGEIDVDGDAARNEVAALIEGFCQDRNAQAFARIYNGRLLYAHDVGSWFGYKDGRWLKDDIGKVGHLIRIMSRNTRGLKAKEARHHNAIRAMCQADPVFAVKAAETFDRDNYLLNTPAGAVDLRTGTMIEHHKDLMLSKMTRISPCSDPTPRFDQFLQEITLGDTELITFLQVSLGACLSGALESHWLLFWTGVGRNGKNTLGDLVMWILGDYAKKVPAATLMSKSSEGHPTEIASLLGVRLAVSSEVAEGEFWHETRINELTGDSMISARFMRQDFFEFERTHKHLIFGNNRPRLKTISDALKSRIKIVPWKATFAGREDPLLSEKLRGEGSGVLSWLIEGHRLWVAGCRKLPACKAVEAESAEYFSSQSVVEMWVDECLELIPNDERVGREIQKAGHLYQHYHAWKELRGEKAVSQVLWGETMSRRFGKVLAAGSRYRGCRLKIEPPEEF